MQILKLFFCFSFLFVFLILGGDSFAQIKDSSISVKNPDTLKFLKFDESAFNYKNYFKNPNYIDTSLTGIQKNHLLNEINPFIAKFSNSGLAYRDIDFKAVYNFDFVSSRKYYKNYLLNNENAQYYNVNTPYTDAYFVMGPKREQILNLLFTRNLKKNLNISINYKLIYSLGTYLRQKSDDSFLILTSNFNSNNKRYVVLGNYFFNRIINQENGGIKNDSIFSLNLESRRQLINVNLNNAENRVKESGFFIKQYYFLGFKKNNENDSVSKKNFVGFGRISHNILFKNQSYTYFDYNPRSGFYPLVLLNNTFTHDSIHINTIENTVSWSNLKFENSELQPFFFSFGLKHKYSKLYGCFSDTSLISFIPEVNFDGRINNNFNINLSGFYFASGYNKSDFSFSGIFSGKLKNNNFYNENFGFKLDYFCQSPSWYDQNYYSNHFIWNYSFEQILTKKANVFLNFKKFDVSFNLYQIKNYLYYDNYARPKQYSDNIGVAQIEIAKNFKLNNWQIDNKVVYQTTDNSDILRFPEIMSNHAVYFEHLFFKKALTAQFGFEVTFFSAYYPLDYMPATREFYLQNNYKSNNYPYLDFFVNARIKRARLYIKIDHLNSGFTDYNYFLIPHYPMADRALKFGISWRFYN